MLGAPLATVITFAATGAGCASRLHAGSGSGAPCRVDVALVLRVAKVAPPASIHGIVFTVVSARRNVAGGDAGASALGPALRSGSRTSVGFAAAAAAVAGQCVGARKPQRATDGGSSRRSPPLPWALTWTSMLRGLAMTLWFARGRWAGARVQVVVGTVS